MEKEKIITVKRKKKRRKKKKMIWNILFLLCLGVFLFSTFNIAKEYYGSFKASSDLKNIKKKVITTKEVTDGTGTQKDVTIEKVINIDELKKINKDSVGWIEIPGTSIDEPIVQGSDNDFYLWRSFYKKKYPVTGAIFLDMYNNSNFNDRISYVFGHNIWDKTKFYPLIYFEDKEFLKNHKEIFITLEDKLLEYEVMGVNLVDPNTPLYELTSDRNNDVEKMKKDLSVYIPSEEVEKIDEKTKILMLVTCKKQNDSTKRRILFAKLKEITKPKK